MAKVRFGLSTQVWGVIDPEVQGVKRLDSVVFKTSLSQLINVERGGGDIKSVVLYDDEAEALEDAMERLVAAA